MVRRFLWLLAVLLTPSLTQAQPGSERYLPSGSQIFWQWDGFDAHKDAIAKTAFGQTLAGDTGTFLGAALKYARQGLDLAKQHTDPNLIDAAQDAIDAGAVLLRNGAAFGAEVGSVQPTQVQAILVLNKSGGEKSKLLALIRRAKDFAGDFIQEEKVGNRTIQVVDSFVKAGWWSEGDDLIVAIGTDNAADYLKKIDAKKVGLEKHPLFQTVKKAPEFTAWSRGFLDASALVKLGADVSPDMATLMDDLGLKGVKNVIGYSGFDGPTCRTIIELDIPGPRKGLGSLLASGRKIKLDELPPLPSDVSSFSAASFNPTKAYNSVLDSVGAFTKLFLGQENFGRDMIQQIEALAGVKFGDDLLGSLDDLLVNYSAPSDGILGLGAVMTFKVKDEKLRNAIEAIAKAIPQIPGADGTTIKKRMYQGAEIVEFHMQQEGNYKTPSFVVHKGWIAYSDYPQAIKGFILRLDGKLPTWKTTDEVKKAMEPFPKEFSAVQFSDPRPGIQAILSMPPLASAGNGFVGRVEGLKPFDVGLIPNAQEATRLLFPSVSVTTDDGRKIRMETRSSLP